MLFFNKKKKTNSYCVQKSIKTLNYLRKGQSGIIVQSNNRKSKNNEQQRRLLELGFIPGETIKVIAEAFPKYDPIVVKVGQTCFAFRRYELDDIHVKINKW